MNISDSERVSAVLENIGYQKASNALGADVSAEALAKADLIVVTMCSVRQSAVDRVHGLVQKIKKLKAKSQKLKVVLTGCILKKDKKIFVQGFDYVIDIKDIKKLPEILQNPFTCKVSDRTLYKLDGYLDITPKYTSKFSANVPIMTGCNNFCAYCVVPYARDREISRPAKKIISEVKNLIKGGYKEIWLLGQNVNSYSNVLENNRIVGFPKLLEMVNDIPGNFWIRFTSSHPKDFNDEVISAMASYKKVTPYLNLPVQAGDNKVLRSMNRRYTVRDYKNKIKKLREKIPGIALSTDIIVGFPGETKKQFENTAKLFREIKYDMAYINKYSPRAGTAASKLKDNVTTKEKKRREKALTKVLKQTALAKNRKIIGKTTNVLVDSKRNNFYFGKNDHYKTIKIISNKNLLGKLTKVKITDASPFILKGKLTNEQ